MTDSISASTHKRLPPWLRRSLAMPTADNTHGILERYRLNTVCESAVCPNQNECYSAGTATFMILGNLCTRRCGFCAIDTAKPGPVEADEPDRVASAVLEMGLEYVVITSVARDDLQDEGSGHFVRTIQAIREKCPEVQIEILTPDFHAREDLIAPIVHAKPVVFNHNLETVKRLQKAVRPQATYDRSLEVLRTIKKIDEQMTTKSGIMLGLGETHQEIMEAGRDLRSAGCDILTVGQYLPPGKNYMPVVEFVSPDTFASLAESLKSMGFREVFAGPHVRSSYHAGETFLSALPGV